MRVHFWFLLAQKNPQFLNTFIQGSIDVITESEHKQDSFPSLPSAFMTSFPLPASKKEIVTVVATNMLHVLSVFGNTNVVPEYYIIYILVLLFSCSPPAAEYALVVNYQL